MNAESISEVPEPPIKLNKYAENEWMKQTGQLSKLNMLCEMDMSLLLAYCLEVGKYFEIQERIKSNITFTTPNGHIQVLPEVTEANKALQNIIKMSSLFGFNPAARTKIEAPPQAPKDIADEF
jgi:P27 family predicted phage terminase small subunit